MIFRQTGFWFLVLVILEFGTGLAMLGNFWHIHFIAIPNLFLEFGTWFAMLGEFWIFGVQYLVCTWFAMLGAFGRTGGCTHSQLI